jgi:hypothetical protein
MFLLVQATSQLMYGRCEICRNYLPLNGSDKSIISFIGYGITHSNNHTTQIRRAFNNLSTLAGKKAMSGLKQVCACWDMS